MPVTQDQIDSFHHFASQKLSNGGAEMSMDELYQLWRIDNPTPDEQVEIHAAIRRGLDDVAAGRFESADIVMQELREKHGISHP